MSPIPYELLPPEEQLARCIRHGARFRFARVSSAQAKGAAKNYAYWGVARYEIALTSDGLPKMVCTRRAQSDRRSELFAYDDLRKVLEQEDRIQYVGTAGVLTRAECANILGVVGHA